VLCNASRAIQKIILKKFGLHDGTRTRNLPPLKWVTLPICPHGFGAIGGNRTHILCLEDRNPKTIGRRLQKPLLVWRVLEPEQRRLHMLEQSKSKGVLLTPCVQGFSPRMAGFATPTHGGVWSRRTGFAPASHLGKRYILLFRRLLHKRFWWELNSRNPVYKTGALANSSVRTVWWVPSGSNRDFAA
jgi:hypothetical protein